ncbi:Uma2 family endonuclease [Emticicia agri]|uniref:Uma2 family endonuclease n=1 Tax=Emticicia agri TaxID=2492393 RepID=A0A4Q5LQW2_9BACT|nr:Uma2 family endonuclease [Emticicia agri]RYU91845.1 Uma2 family endonuclease [Emticicia agri]
MGQADLKKYYSVEEYFELEEISNLRHEYYKGKFFELESSTLNHNRIIGNIANNLLPIVRKRGWDIFTESVKLETIKENCYLYPDVMLTCDADDLKQEFFIRQPSLIIEVLSDSTTQYDHDFKLRQYKSIRSVQYYMLVSQNEVRIELYSRLNDFQWQYEDVVELSQTINLEKLNITLSLVKTYNNIIFDSTEESNNH